MLPYTAAAPIASLPPPFGPAEAGYTTPRCLARLALLRGLPPSMHCNSAGFMFFTRLLQPPTCGCEERQQVWACLYFSSPQFSA